MNLKSRVNKMEQKLRLETPDPVSLILINSVSPEGSPNDGPALAWFVAGPLAGQEFRREPDETPREFEARIKKLENEHYSKTPISTEVSASTNDKGNQND